VRLVQYKAELIHRRAPWKTRESVELETLEWVPWFNHKRLHSSIGYIPPAEAEANYYNQLGIPADKAVLLQPNSFRANRGDSWRVRDDAERLDGHNGLMLSPHLDKPFDRGWISFEDNLASWSSQRYCCLQSETAFLVRSTRLGCTRPGSKVALVNR
jgi:hypothetical protein